MSGDMRERAASRLLERAECIDKRRKGFRAFWICCSAAIFMLISIPLGMSAGPASIALGLIVATCTSLYPIGCAVAHLNELRSRSLRLRKAAQLVLDAGAVSVLSNLLNSWWLEGRATRRELSPAAIEALG